MFSVISVLLADTAAMRVLLLVHKMISSTLRLYAGAWLLKRMCAFSGYRSNACAIACPYNDIEYIAIVCRSLITQADVRFQRIPQQCVCYCVSIQWYWVHGDCMQEPDYLSGCALSADTAAMRVLLLVHTMISSTLRLYAGAWLVIKHNITLIRYRNQVPAYNCIALDHCLDTQ